MNRRQSRHPRLKRKKKQESEEVLTLTQQEGVVTFSESEEGNCLTSVRYET